MSSDAGLPSNRKVALLPAGGGGSRFGSDLPKQYADLLGVPMIRRTIDRLATALDLDAIYVAIAADDLRFDACVGLVESANGAHSDPSVADDRSVESEARAGCGESTSRVRVLRCGGPTRAATVANALAIIASEIDADDWVLVHDAARPCVPVEVLRRLVTELESDATGGLLAIPAADTLKRSDGATPLRVLRTEDRSSVWYAQTPQMFRCGLLRAALSTGEALAATDEAQAIEALASRGDCAWPRLVTGSAQNIKVTYPDDLKLAAAILGIQGPNA